MINYPLFYFIALIEDGVIHESCILKMSDNIYYMVGCAGLSLNMLSNNKELINKIACVNFASYLVLHVTGIFMEEYCELYNIASEYLTIYPTLLVAITSVLCLIYLLLWSLKPAQLKR